MINIHGIFEDTDGKFYHSDEVYSDMYGPFLSEAEAHAAMIVYARYHLSESPPPTTPQPRWGCTPELKADVHIGKPVKI